MLTEFIDPILICLDSEQWRHSSKNKTKQHLKKKKKNPYLSPSPAATTPVPSRSYANN